MNKQQENGFLNNYSQTIKTIKLLAFIALLMSLIAITFLSLSQALAEELIWFVFYPIVVLASIYGGVVTGFFVILLSCITIHFVLSQFLPFPISTSHLNYTATLIFISLSSFIHYLLCVLKRMQSQVVCAQKNHQNEILCHSIINSMPNMVGYWNKNLYCLFANEAYQEWFNKTPQEIIGMTFRELAGEDLYQLNQENIQAVLAGKPQRFERVLTKVNGTESSIIGQYIPHFAEDGSVVGFSSIASEITDLKETQAQLKLAAYVFDNTIDGVLVTDLQGNILSVNPAFVDITGYSAHEALGQTPRILKSNRYSQDFYAYMWHQIQTTGKWNGELWSRRKNGDEFLERLSIRMVRDQDGNPLRYISVFSDITELWRKNEHLKHLAFYDALTNLPNRLLLMERLNQKILNAKREPCNIALMFMDLDGFKLVNDNFGHDVGDDMLKIIAQRLLSLVRDTDTVARLGGDEFIFVLHNPSGKDEIEAVAQRVINSLNEPIEIKGETFTMGASIGIAEYPSSSHSSTELIKNADRAMYLAKASGKNQISFFISSLLVD